MGEIFPPCASLLDEYHPWELDLFALPDDGGRCTTGDEMRARNRTCRAAARVGNRFDCYGTLTCAFVVVRGGPLSKYSISGGGSHITSGFLRLEYAS